MSSPDDGSEQAVVAGNARTPPPRSRRGAPVTRTAPKPVPESVDLDDDDFDEEDDDFDADVDLDDDPDAALWAPASSAASPTKRASDPEPAPPSKRYFDWDSTSKTDDRPAPGPTATVAAASVSAAVDPEPEVEAPFVAPSQAMKRAKVVKRPERRFRQTIVKVDLWSVTKMALCFYVSAMAVTVVALVALWVVADSAGIIGNVEKFIGDLFSSKDFHFVSAQVLRGAILVAVALVALMVVFTIIAASFYNIFAELFGGVEVVIREEENPPKR